MRIASLMLMIALGACGAKAPQPSDPASVDIASTDFALLPCHGVAADTPCVLVMAGGKRVLMGAPTGVTMMMKPTDLRQLDAVLLFSLRADDLQGLDDLRNETWRAGRDQALRVSGPPGTRDILNAINKIYETSDALIFVERGGAGGFDAPVLRPSPGENDTKALVFDTGDLAITHLVNTDGRVGYWVDYNDQRVVISPCGMEQALKFAETSDFALVCALPEDMRGTQWPLQDVIFINPDDEKEGL